MKAESTRIRAITLTMTPEEAATLYLDLDNMARLRESTLAMLPVLAGVITGGEIDAVRDQPYVAAP